MKNLKTQLVAALEKIAGVEDRPSPVSGGSALFYSGKEIAHFHHNNELDLKLSRKIIKSEGLRHPENSEFHPKRSPNSPWIELRFYNDRDIQDIVELVKKAVASI